ncbi:MAG TPA: periplasmic heavy metal sensor [Hyphomicrobiaceae bacterium]|nr:periplasmic heavy metal sensor [Hyphomicrobiaceae bacterium]
MSRTGSETGPETPVKPARGRWWKIALVLSLALNLLLIGAAAATFARIRSGALPTGVSTNLIGFATTLPPSRRHELWQATREERSRMRPLRADLREARMQVREAFLADPFDRERFSAAQSRLLEAETRARTEAQRLFASMAARMTREERAAFMQWETSHRRAGRGWWRQLERENDGDGRNGPPSGPGQR